MASCNQEDHHVKTTGGRNKVPKIVYILTYVGSLGRWALSAKHKLIKAKDLQESPNPAHNYPGDEVFKAESLSPELVAEIEAFLTADQTPTSQNSGPEQPSVPSLEAISQKSVASGHDQPASYSQEENSGPSQDMEIDLPGPKPGEVITEPTKEEISEAGLFEFPENDSWDRESNKNPAEFKSPEPSPSPPAEDQDVLTLHVSSNEFSESHEGVIRPTQPSSGGKREREPSSAESLAGDPQPGPSSTSTPVNTRSKSKPAKKKVRSASCTTRPLADPKFQKAINAVKEDQIKPHGKLDSLVRERSDSDADSLDSTIERNLPTIPLVSRGTVDPEAARNLANMGHYVLKNEADRCGVANHPYINTLLKITSPNRARSLSTARQKQNDRFLNKPVSPETAKLAPFTTRGRRRVSSKQLNDATRQKIDGKIKNLKPRD